ncbi:MAG: hypothetical protein H6813_00785 [Phycisphaeraceae bacterium]|nr:hypothetical protein [Phycisphaeraceae bacterium]MCB9847379.1 hypothetical protein [Phycisphaeraceae bacterium]
MNLKTRMLAIAALVTAAGGTSAIAAPTTDADGVRALVAEMIADAESRSSLLQSGGTAGHNGHFFLSSADGNFTLNFSGQSQTRYTLNFNDDNAVDDFTPGFNQPRTALRFDGQIYGEFGYAIQGMFNRAGGGFTLEDAYIHTDLGDGLTLLFGQLRMPVLWEDMLSETHSLAADQSVVNAVFGQGRSQGIWLHQSNEDWRWWAGFSDGLNSANSDFGASPADWALTGRLEFKADGDWSQFDQFTSASGSAYAAKLGLAAHWQQSPDAPLANQTDVFAYSIDGQAEGDGWNAYVAFVGLHTAPDVGTDTDDFGIVAQGGIFVSDDWEVFGRWDLVSPDSNRAGNDDFNTITVGANYYIHGQAAKFTVDLQWFLNDSAGNDLVNGIAASNSLGLTPSAENDEIAIRAQFQLLF